MLYESWMMNLDINLKSQKQKVFLIMDKNFIHYLEHVGRDESFWFSILQYINIIIAFLPPNV